MERQTGRSGAVCRSVARGVLGQASLAAYGSVRWLKVWLGAGANSARRNGHTSGTEASLTWNGGCQVWSRRCKIPKCLEWHCNRMTNFLNPSFCAAVNEAAYG